ncbi:hypothetical protein SLEP1_g41375 [Rubroshorea leprosula]|uniref:Uncharacterized protein n=1 Tax=Rubroshorea leprosula TaxID=152421 RepID=A0AAV5L791_9ROSI|nr:hypothetical protein SLEP1_g41375 [Rubroshorea leprosula]
MNGKTYQNVHTYHSLQKLPQPKRLGKNPIIQCYVGIVCNLKCLYFCWGLKLLALSAKPLDKRSFSASTPSRKAALILYKRKDKHIIRKNNALTTYSLGHLVLFQYSQSNTIK